MKMKRDLEENAPLNEQSLLLSNTSTSFVKDSPNSFTYQDGPSSTRLPAAQYNEFQNTTCIIDTTTTTMNKDIDDGGMTPCRHRRQPLKQNGRNMEHNTLFQCIVYAAINIILSVPCLYGYAAVIFNNPVFNSHRNSLSKLVIFSSFIHQLGFTLFSSLPFAIGTVQDAGLIFLSAMSNTVVTEMKGKDEKAILSTTLIMLCGGTAMLGIILILMGRLRIANAVSYLPLPVSLYYANAQYYNILLIRELSNSSFSVLF